MGDRPVARPGADHERVDMHVRAVTVELPVPRELGEHRFALFHPRLDRPSRKHNARGSHRALALHIRMCNLTQPFHREPPIPTNLALDDKLIEEARSVGGHKTKKEAVTVALQEYIARRKQLGLLELFGTIEYDPEYDYKAARKRDIQSW